METKLTAQQAQELSKNGRERLIEKILEKIKSTAEGGGRSVAHWSCINGIETDLSAEQNQLEELGYTVSIKYSEANNEHQFLISW